MHQESVLRLEDFQFMANKPISIFQTRCIQAFYPNRSFDSRDSNPGRAVPAVMPVTCVVIIPIAAPQDSIVPLFE
jgi:hypothetical protein